MGRITELDESQDSSARNTKQSHLSRINEVEDESLPESRENARFPLMRTITVENADSTSGVKTLV